MKGKTYKSRRHPWKLIDKIKLVKLTKGKSFCFMKIVATKMNIPVQTAHRWY